MVVASTPNTSRITPGVRTSSTGPGGDRRAVVEDDDQVAEAGGEVQVVKDGQGAGEEDALAFASGEGGVIACGEGADTAAVDGVGDGTPVVGALAAGRPVVGSTADLDDLGHGAATCAARRVLEYRGGSGEHARESSRRKRSP
ncbi:hypothetical protein GCM10010221_70990 [Streptomyces parvus]|nr:hypothetical protein GCM10010221_70990 [Streptomyces parvus]